MSEEGTRRAAPGDTGFGSDAAIIRSGLLELAGLAGRVARDLAEPASRAAGLAVQTLEEGGTLLFCGNGGSAADAQHLAAEYVVRFQRQRGGLPAIALTTDSSVLTAAGNDFGFDEVFARQIEALARPGDLLFLHSTSGESTNLLRAAEVAREHEVGTVALLAKGGGRLAARVDLALVVPTQVTARAQELHIALGHLVCDLVDRRMASRGRR